MSKWIVSAPGLKLLISSPLILSALGLALAVAESDWPPWISKTSVNSLFLVEYAKQSMKDYCDAERASNLPAAEAANEDVATYEMEYTALNPGRTIVLRPCP